jgi:hypothetical protein
MKTCFSAKSIKRRATVKELFNIFYDFMKEKSIKWSDCVEYAQLQHT